MDNYCFSGFSDSTVGVVGDIDSIIIRNGDD
jgi:hypothetical protein